MSRRNLSVLFASLLIGLLCAVRSEHNPSARVASRGFALIDDLALEQPSDEELLAGAMRGMVETLRRRGDEHSAYIEPRRAEPFQAEMRQEFGGIGVRIAVEGDPPRVTVVEPPLPGSPAYRGGVMSRDRIVAVDGESIIDLPQEEVLGRMRGPVGEPITLSVERGEEPEQLSIRLVREVIRVPSVIGDLPLADGGWQFALEGAPEIALLRITTFGNRTADELRDAIARLKQSGVRAVVIDVRGNGGGAVDAAIGVAELFLPDGAEIFSTRGRGGEVLSRYQAWGGAPFGDLPLAVLIDRDSASASELLAAALQDHGLAVVVGERSYGKGTVQQVLELNPAGALLKLTSASFWRPSGEEIHRSPDKPVGSAGGVTPDDGLLVAMTDSERLAFYKWRRQRDLLPSDAEGADQQAEDALTADAALAKAVESLKQSL